MQYRDGNGDVHDWVEPSSASKRGCIIPVAIVSAFISVRFWWMLSEPSGINNQAGAHLVAIGGLFGLCIALPATAILLYSIVGIIKPDWVWREPF